MSIRQNGQIIAGSSKKLAAYNVGDTFFTMRTDNELNGAVECNGATYNTDDFDGVNNIGSLLAAAKVPYVSLATYDTLLLSQGSCGVFGWDGVGTTAFRVPSLNDIFIEAGTAAQIGDYIPAGIPNITGDAAMGDRGANITGSGAFASARIGSSTPKFTTQNSATSSSNGWSFDASRSSDVYKDDVDTVQPNTVRYRAMVQLATAATDEALETCTGVLADVAELKSHEVIEFQAPTAENNYTWYRKYADGWVEQGGSKASGGSGNHIIDLPVTMSDTAFWAQVTRSSGASTTTNVNVWVRTPTSTSQITVYTSDDTGIKWEVKGIYAQ